jgi:hypothetical protein
MGRRSLAAKLVFRSLSMTPADYRREPPMPPGAGYKPLVASVYSSRKARRC